MSSQPSPVPTRLGRFEVGRLLGRGAMGDVFEGTDPDLHRLVALKLLNPQCAADAQYRERFRREAIAMARVAHPHVVAVHEYGEHEGRPFIAMELVDGGDCDRLLTQGRLELVRAIRFVREAALGLGAASEKGLVHRDVKPANFMVHHDHVKVSDFGIARVQEGSAALTQMGMVMGTPSYMAPEQAMGMPVDLRADLYALGCSAFHLLTGELPFPGDNVGVVLSQQLSTPLPDPRSRRPEIPVEVAELLGRLTQKKPEARLGSYDEVARVLAPFCGEAESAAGGTAGALRFTEGALAGKTIQLPATEFVVGRAAECQLVLDTVQASRRHASFNRDAQGVLVRDLGSRNGVLVNGVRVQSQRLRVGDRVKVASETFLVVPGGPMAAPTPQLETGPAPTRAGLLRDLARGALAGGSLELTSLDPLVLDSLLPLRRLVVLRVEEGRFVPRHQVARGEADRSLAPHQALLVEVARDAKARMVLDARPLGAAVATVACAPLLSREGRVLGLLYGDAREPQAFGAEELATLEAAALLISPVFTRQGPAGQQAAN